MSNGESSNASDTRRRRAIAFAALCLASIYPLAAVIGPNLGVVPLDTGIVLRIFLASVGAALSINYLLAGVIKDEVARATWICCVLLLCGTYGFGIRLLRGIGFDVDLDTVPMAIAYALAILVAANLIVRPWRPALRDPTAWLIAATAFVGVNAYQGLVRIGSADTTPAFVDFVAEVRQDATSGRENDRTDDVTLPDIYYVVLDGFGRDDVIRRYGGDIDPLLSFLSSNGFFVPREAQSNYSQTFLSIASVLNATYLDDVARHVGRESRDRAHLAALIQQSSVMQLARMAGFTVVGIGSDYMATQHLDAADVCICRPHGLDAVEQAVINLTPLAAIPWGRWTYDAHRRNVLDAFAALEAPPESDAPRFVFAHIVAPHPPFVFDADGRARRPGGIFGFEDGSHFRESRTQYVEGYRDQVRFIASRLIVALERILEQRGRPVAIVVHADHGPGADLNWESPDSTDMTERMGIFAAYRLPGFSGELPATLTPINGVRALVSTYFGVDLPSVDDRSWFSTWSRPYDFIEVPPTGRRTDLETSTETSSSHPLAVSDDAGP